MHYRLIQHNHSTLLSEVLYDVYELKNGLTEKRYTTAPNGIIGIAFFLEGDSHLKENQGWNKAPESCIYGLIKKPDLIKISPNFREIAIGFKPFFFHLLVSNPMSDIVNCPHLNTKEIFKASAVDKLQEELHTCDNDRLIIQAIEEFILAHIRNKYDQRVLHVMRRIYSAETNRVDSLCEELNVSSNTLRNLCLSGLGRSTKEMIQIIRINKTLSSIQPNLSINLQDIAFNNGYFDQAHFIHDFKSTMHMTPKKYFDNKDLTFDFYNSKRWNGDIFDETSH